MAAAGIHSGLPCGCADDLESALRAMRGKPASLNMRDICCRSYSLILNCNATRPDDWLVKRGFSASNGGIRRV
nr:PHB depolymerase family esterase [Methylocystis sp. H62]